MAKRAKGEAGELEAKALPKGRKAKPKERKTKERGNGRGTVWELPDGRYRWQITLGYTNENKRKSASGTAKDKRTAELELAKAVADNARGLLAEPDKVTVAQFAERWLSRQRARRPRSAKLCRVEIGYALGYIGKKRVRDVRPGHLKELMGQLPEHRMKLARGRGEGGPMSPRTQAKVLTRLKALFAEAVGDQIIHVSPAAGLKRADVPPAEPVGVALDRGEAARLHELGEALHAAGLCRLWPALFAAVSVGLRRGEVMGLRWEDVDLGRGVLRVRQARSTDDGAVVNTGTKTFRSTRDIGMPASLIAALAAHRDRQALERERAGSAWEGSGAVFATASGGWVHPSHCNRALADVLRWSDPEELAARREAARRLVGAQALARLEAAVSSGERLPDLSPHDLRHTYATLALRSGVPVEVVSKTLGHAKISITLDTYRHVLESERREHVIDLFAAPPPLREARPAAVN